jgi:AraC-like DNA-binding protein
MGDWTNATASQAGVLRPHEFARYVQLDRRPAGPLVSHWVENHWSLDWDLPEGATFASQVLAHPTASLTAELGSHPRPGLPDGCLFVTGVATRRFDVDTRGWGRVAGVRFRPGGLTALTGQAASGWTDRTVPAGEVLPTALCAELADRALVETPARWAAVAEAGLAALDPDPDLRYDELLGIVADMLGDRSLLTVKEVGRRHGMTARTLQRLFLHFIGVGPKWVLARYRMHDVVTDLDDGYGGTLTDLAQRYGWYDQAHFIRDFVALVGVPPRAYRGTKIDGPARSRPGTTLQGG